MSTDSSGLLVGFFMILLLRGLFFIVRNAGDGEVPARGDAPPEFTLPGALPLLQSLRARWLNRFEARNALEGEWLLDLDEPADYRVTLPMPRRLVRLEFEFDSPRPAPLDDVVVTSAGGSDVAWCGRWRRRGGKSVLRLDFAGTVRLTGVTLKTRLSDAVDCELRLRLIAAGEPDAPHLEAAHAARRQRMVHAFIRNLVRYEEHCQTNPVSALHLASLYRIRGDRELAEVHALRALGLGRAQLGLEICRDLARERPWELEDEHLRALKDKAAAWELAGHHGLVVLLQERSYRTGPGGYVREHFHAAYLVRRRAAARKFRSLAVPFGAGAGGLIHTQAVVRRADGTSEMLDDDRFTVGSAQDDNPFIAVARKRTGIWILNDLAPGDVVEYTWDIVRLGRNEQGKHDLFMLANIADTDTPTLRASVSFCAPAEWDLSFAVRNGNPVRSESRESGTEWRRTEFTMERVLPRRSHSLPFQHAALNPLVAAALAGPDWATVGREILQSSLDAVAATSAVPAPLTAACAGSDEQRERLARAFYWVRDRIKYASIASANRDLGSPERAERIAAAGVGDCKDASFLLAVVCRHNGIPWEFVLMSTENGIVLEELPADQFDHMLVRARLNEEWLYLDAAGDATLFGSPPFPFQGVTVLTGPQGGSLVPLSEIPAERTRVVIHEKIESIDAGQLAGSVDLHLEGHPARMVDEMWKHQSLVSLDPERAADEAIRHMLPDYEIRSMERLADTAAGDTLHVHARGRRGRLVPLDGHRIVALSFAAPALPAIARRTRHYEERYAFLMRAEFVYRLELTGEVRGALRGISAVEDLATAFCSVSEERLTGDGTAGIVRRIRLNTRLVEGADLADLPAALDRIEDSTHVVVSLAGEERAAGA